MTHDTAWVPEAQRADLQRLKGYFPFRIVYAAFNPETGEWQQAAVTTMRAPRRLARLGWRVVTA